MEYDHVLFEKKVMWPKDTEIKTSGHYKILDNIDWADSNRPKSGHTQKITNSYLLRNHELTY